MKKLFKMALCSTLLAIGTTGAFAASYNTSTNWFDTTNVNHINVIGKNISKSNSMPTTAAFKVTDNENMNTDVSATTDTIYIYNKNLQYVENDNELAAIIAAELGHIVNGHGAKSSLVNSAIANFNPSTATDNSAATVNLLKTISSSKLSKENIKEADITAVDLLAKAGYNPLALISVVYRTDISKTGGLLDSELSCEDRIMYIYDYTNYNYPDKVKAGYKTDSYTKASALINANLQIRQQNPKKVEKVKKEQEKLQKAKLKRIKNMAKSTNPWSSAYSVVNMNASK